MQRLNANDRPMRLFASVLVRNGTGILRSLPPSTVGSKLQFCGRVRKISQNEVGHGTRDTGGGGSGGGVWKRSQQMSILWADKNEDSMPFVKIMCPAPNECYLVRFLGSVTGVWVHFDPTKKASRPCHTEGCDLCGREPRRWKGYAPVLLWRRKDDGHCSWTKMVLELTEATAGKLQGDLRGRVAEISRPGKRRNGAVRLTWIEKPVAGDLPPAFDVRPILENLWGIRQPMKEEKPEESMILKFKKIG